MEQKTIIKVGETAGGHNVYVDTDSGELIPESVVMFEIFNVDGTSRPFIEPVPFPDTTLKFYLTGKLSNTCPEWFAISDWFKKVLGFLPK